MDQAPASAREEAEQYMEQRREVSSFSDEKRIIPGSDANLELLVDEESSGRFLNAPHPLDQNRQNSLMIAQDLQLFFQALIEMNLACAKHPSVNRTKNLIIEKTFSIIMQALATQESTSVILDMAKESLIMQERNNISNENMELIDLIGRIGKKEGLNQEDRAEEASRYMEAGRERARAKASKENTDELMDLRRRVGRSEVGNADQTANTCLQEAAKEASRFGNAKQTANTIFFDAEDELSRYMYAMEAQRDASNASNENIDELMDKKPNSKIVDKKRFIYQSLKFMANVEPEEQLNIKGVVLTYKSLYYDLFIFYFLFLFSKEKVALIRAFIEKKHLKQIEKIMREIDQEQITLTSEEQEWLTELERINNSQSTTFSFSESKSELMIFSLSQEQRKNIDRLIENCEDDKLKIILEDIKGINRYVYSCYTFETLIVPYFVNSFRRVIVFKRQNPGLYQALKDIFFPLSKMFI